MNIASKIYCRTFQLGFRAALPILPYREPKIINSCAKLKSVFEKEDIREFYESFTSQAVKMRKELLSIKKIRNKDKKAKRLTDSLVNFMNESGFWKMLDNMLDKMMPK